MPRPRDIRPARCAARPNEPLNWKQTDCEAKAQESYTSVYLEVTLATFLTSDSYSLAESFGAAPYFFIVSSCSSTYRLAASDEFSCTLFFIAIESSDTEFDR